MSFLLAGREVEELEELMSDLCFHQCECVLFVVDDKPTRRGADCFPSQKILVEATCHAPEWEGCYDQIRRVLKPGGVVRHRSLRTRARP